MKKHNTRKLRLNASTIRLLVGPGLADVVGGVDGNTLTTGSGYTVCLTRMRNQCSTSLNTICVPNLGDTE